MHPFEEIWRSLKAHPSEAQILLQLDGEEGTFEEALEILQDKGGRQIKYEFISEGSSSFVLFYLPSNNMRGAVLKLRQTGFTRLKGMNAIEFSRENKQ
ncbi:MAG: hypothetical protein JXA79_10125 [Deltaproteobacteria bacterium]|nr:hypothetical protein [Deltaproteobacteria bacterium]